MVNLIVGRHPELESFLPKLKDEELEQLRLNITSRGCDQDFYYCIIDGKNWQLDGHNSRTVCDEINVPYCGWKLVKEITKLEEAKDWIWKHQGGRRNMTAKELAYFRGREYLREKKPHGEQARMQNEGARVEVSPSGQNDHLGASTAANLAQRYGVSPETIRRDAEYAKLVEMFCDRCKRGKRAACPACRKLELDVKDGTIKLKMDDGEVKITRPPPAKKPPAAKKPPKPGTQKFDWQDFDKKFGPVAQLPDKIAAAYPGEKNSEDFKECQRALGDFLKTFKAWKKRLTK